MIYAHHTLTIMCMHAVAAIIATRNDQELWELFDQANIMDLSFFSNTTMSQFVRHFLLKGVLQDVEVLQKRLRRLLGDATFLQAFAHSGVLPMAAWLFMHAGRQGHVLSTPLSCQTLPIS